MPAKKNRVNGKNHKPVSKAKKAPKPNKPARQRAKPVATAPTRKASTPQELAFRNIPEPSFAFVEALLTQMRREKTSALIAARYLGVDETTFSQWMQIGELDAETRVQSMFAYLVAVIDAADAGIEAALISKIAASRDWRGIAWLAERKWPLRYDAALLRLRGIERNQVAADTPAWEEPIVTSEEAAETLATFETLVAQGTLALAAILQNPEDPDDKTPGLRSIIAEALRHDIEHGRKLPQEVARQVIDFFKENPSSTDSSNETAQVM
jgi:hypothetical protein